MKTPLIQKRSGFTLIELLATVTIIALLVAFLGQVFSQASMAWERGTQQVIRNANAKAALEIIARDLEMAVVDEQFGFLKDRRGMDGWPIDFDQLYFVTLGGRAEDERSYQLVSYVVRSDNYLDRDFRSTRLIRDEMDFEEMKDKNGEPFRGEWWKKPPFRPTDFFTGTDYSNAPVIDDVVRFDVYLHTGDDTNFGENPTRQTGATAGTDGNKHHDYNTHDPTTLAYAADTHRIPPYIDIYLQVTSPDAMRRADALRAAGNNDAARELLDANSNVLFKRVYPRMRNAIR